MRDRFFSRDHVFDVLDHRLSAISSFGDSAVETEAKKLGLARSTAYKSFQKCLASLRPLFPELEP